MSTWIIRSFGLLLISSAFVLPAQAAITSPLAVGAQSTEVTELHRSLSNLGYLSGVSTSAFTANTKAALVKFQSCAGFSATGTADAATRTSLNALAAFTAKSGAAAKAKCVTGSVKGAMTSFMSGITAALSRGSQGPQVTLAQQALAQLGYFTAQTTGYFGPATKAAVLAFQAATGIETIGSIGPKTRAALNDALLGTPVAEAATRPAVTLTANPTSVVSGGSTTISWSSTGASYCMAGGAWSGFKGTSGSQAMTNLTANKTYSITCYGSGSTAQSVMVTVTQAPAPTLTFAANPTSVLKNATTTLSWSTTNATGCTASGGWTGSQAISGNVSKTVTATTTYTLSCTGAGGSVAKSVTVGVVPPAAPTLTLNANPTSVLSGATTTLSWSSTNTTSCTASGGWSGTKAVSGSASQTLTATTTYTLSCTGSGGSVNKSVTVGITPPPVVPAPTLTFAANPTTVNAGGSSTLTWSTTNATSCTASGPGWETTQPTSGSVTISGIAATQTYGLTCSGAGGSIAKSVTVTVNAPVGGNACLAFTMPVHDKLFSQAATANGIPKKVFAEFFGDYHNLSVDNVTAASDFYNTNWLKADPNDPYWGKYGGYLRTRPLPVPAQATNDIDTWQTNNYKKDVQMAIAGGINGFIYQIDGPVTNMPDSSYSPGQPIHRSGDLMTLARMAKAAAAVDKDFALLLMVDSAPIGVSTDQIVPTIINEIGTVCKDQVKYPNMYRINGKFVFGTWDDPGQYRLTPSDFQTISNTLTSQGCPVYIVPTYLNIDQSIVTNYKSAVQGIGLFATAIRDSNNTYFGTMAQQAGLPFMAAIGSQHYRNSTTNPSQYSAYWEAEGSASLRNGWAQAISNGAESPWVQIATWNDHGEATIIQPYTDTSLSGSIGTAYYNLNAYYAAWYLTGQAPTIDHDVLYYFHRREPISASAPNQIGITPTTPPWNGMSPYTNAYAGVDRIEVVGFLTQPGTLSITVGGVTKTSAVLPAGVQSFTANFSDFPLGATGQYPTFTLSRSGQTVFAFQGQTAIYGSQGLPNGYLDLTYWGGSASASGVCTITTP